MAVAYSCGHYSAYNGQPTVPKSDVPTMAWSAYSGLGIYWMEGKKRGRGATGDFDDERELKQCFMNHGNTCNVQLKKANKN